MVQNILISWPCFCLSDLLFSLGEQPTATVSEESCSDATRYVTRDSIEARDINKTNVEMIGQKKDDVYECTPAGENVFIACVQVNLSFTLNASYLQFLGLRSFNFGNDNLRFFSCDSIF